MALIKSEAIRIVIASLCKNVFMGFSTQPKGIVFSIKYIFYDEFCLHKIKLSLFIVLMVCRVTIYLNLVQGYGTLLYLLFIIGIFKI